VTLVIDASVILKWLLQSPSVEPHTDIAVAILESVIDGKAEILQPTHWLAEVAAVLARLSPSTASDDVQRLAALEFGVSDEPAVMQRATQMAVDCGQHVFDTLYHAVAIEHEDATLVTADDRYFAKAAHYGGVLRLSTWTPAQG
jgi:predicted nucleic acid-binding protein